MFHRLRLAIIGTDYATKNIGKQTTKSHTKYFQNKNNYMSNGENVVQKITKHCMSNWKQGSNKEIEIYHFPIQKNYLRMNTSKSVAVKELNLSMWSSLLKFQYYNVKVVIVMNKKSKKAPKCRKASK